jgi:two-component system NtrC family sensor kinase
MPLPVPSRSTTLGQLPSPASGSALAWPTREPRSVTPSPRHRFESPRITSAGLVAGIVAALVVLGVITYVDEKRATEASFADFASQQSEVAKAAAAAFSPATGDRGATPDEGQLLQEARMRLHALEQPGEVVVFLKPPLATTGLLTLEGKTVSSPVIEARLAAGASNGAWLRLTHPEAAELGLPPRTAVAALAEVDGGSEGRWSLIVATTARRERDREERGLWRVFLGFVIASMIVVAVGTLALRKQRTELELARRLAVAEAVQALDERLVRADKLATLGALATGIAHQVSTPLGVIVVRAQRLAPRVAEDAKAQRAVAMISEQAQRINGIVRGFLGLARGGVPTLEHVEPGDIARDAVELVEHRFEKAAVTLAAEVEPGLPQIACDPRLFEQVIVNLLLNACDACQAGGNVQLWVRSVGESVAFIVEDDGAGITEEAVRRATEPFFTTKPPDEGTGLGLAIASEIVNHHHGTLVLEPLPGHGTRARVEVPVAMAEGKG